MRATKGAEDLPTSASISESCDMTGGARLLQHLKEPQNILNYMIFTMWLKIMNIVSFIPTITIGG